MGPLDFQSAYKILSLVHLEHSSFWPSADDKPRKMIWCMQYLGGACLLSLLIYCDLYAHVLIAAGTLMKLGKYHRDSRKYLANMHCQGVACTTLFNMD